MPKSRKSSRKLSRKLSRKSSRKLSRKEEDKIFRSFIKKQLKKFGSDLRMPSVWFHPVTGNQVPFSSRAKRVFLELRKEMGIKGPTTYGRSYKSKSSVKASDRRKVKRSRTKIRKSERVNRSARSCSRQSTGKYSSRNSPPYPANSCCGSVKKGNDGKRYRSKRASNGVCRWVKA